MNEITKGLSRAFGDALVLKSPSPQTQIDVFAGEWAYEIPIAGTVAGRGAQFLERHHSVAQAEQAFGSLRGMSCLELGPNEGEVSFHLHHAGCASVYSIEARARSFLKCLIVKNLLHLHSVEFALGNFVEYLEETDRRFDIVFVCGVLYHMTDPLRLIQRVCEKADRVAVATHYFRPEMQSFDGISDTTGLPTAIWSFVDEAPPDKSVEGFTAKHHRYGYIHTPADEEVHKVLGHGGIENFAAMLELPDLLNAFRHFGFEIVGEITDHPEGPRGAHVAFVAQRAGSATSPGLEQQETLPRAKLSTRIARRFFKRGQP